MPTGRELDELKSAAVRSVPGFIEDLEHLVGIDSGSYTKDGVDEVGGWVTTRLEALGGAVTRHQDVRLGDTIEGVFESASAGPTVLMLGHLDTVFEAGTVAERPFAIRAGRAFGPGVNDMKGGLLVGLHALAIIRDLAASVSPATAASGSASWLPVRRLVFLANSDEEIGAPSSEAIIRQHAAKSDVALVYEAARANGDIVSARKGQLNLRLHITGRAAHAGVEPEAGSSAVLEAAHAVIAIDRLRGCFPGLSANTGVIRGGTRSNIVPNHAVIDLDVRSMTRSDLVAVEAAIREVAAHPTVAGVVTRVEVESRLMPMEPTTASRRLVKNALAIASELGLQISHAATGGGSDGNTVGSMGVPTLDGLGPVGGADHAPGEYIELESIAPRVALTAALLISIGRGAHEGRWM